MTAKRTEADVISPDEEITKETNVVEEEDSMANNVSENKVDNILNDLEELERKRDSLSSGLKEVLKKHQTSYREIGEMMMESIRADFLLKMNHTNSYSQIFEQNGEKFRLALSRAPQTAGTGKGRGRRKRVHAVAIEENNGAGKKRGK